jgi:hypothetical protein
MSTQRTVDHTNDAQRRVTADTEILQGSATLTVPAGSSGVVLDPVVVRLLSVTLGVERVIYQRSSDYLEARSGGYAFQPSAPAYTLLGRTLYLTPDPSADTDLSIVYTKRSGDLDETLTLEVSGGYARAVEMIVAAYALADDGQPELAQQALADYAAESQRLRLHAQRRGVSTSTRTIGLG